MAETIEELIIKIKADLSQVEQEVKGATREVKTATNKMKRAFKSVGQGIGKLGSALKGLGGKLVVATAAFLSFKALMDAMNRADGLAKTAATLALTTQQLTALEFAASQSGATAQDLQAGLRNLSRRSAEAAKGLGEAGRSLKALGIDTAEFVALPVNQQLNKVADGLKNIDNAAEKNLIAGKLFGEESGARLLNLMAQGSKGINTLTTQAHELGITLDDIDAAKIEIANDAMDRLSRFVGGIVQRIAANLAPMIEHVINLFINWANTLPDLDKTWNTVVTAIITGINIVKKGWLGLSVLIAGFQKVSAKIGVWFWDGVKVVAQAIKFWRERWDDALDVMFASFNVTWGLIKSAFWEVVAVLAKPISDLKTEIGSLMLSLAGALKAAGMDDTAEKVGKKALSIVWNANKLGDAAGESLKKAQMGTLKALGKLSEANAAFNSTDINLETPGIDKLVAEAGEVNEEATEKLKAALEAAAAETFGEALTNDLVNFDEFVANYEARALEIAELRREEAEKELNEEEEKNKALEERRQAFLDNITKMERDAMEAQEFLWESGFKGKMQLAGDFLSQIAALMQSENRGMFEVGKASAISGAVVDTYLAANRAYASMAGIPIIGPALGAAAAGAAVVSGIANVQRIKSTQFGSKGGAGGGAAASAPSGASAGGGAAAPGGENVTNINAVIQGERFGANQIRDLIGAINEATDDNVRLNATVQ